MTDILYSTFVGDGYTWLTSPCSVLSQIYWMTIAIIAFPKRNYNYNGRKYECTNAEMNLITTEL